MKLRFRLSLLWSLSALMLTTVLSSCMTIQRTAQMYSSKAPQALIFHYKDGGSSVYYEFNVGEAAPADTLLFFYGATGCPSWKSVMPDYVNGLTVSARIYVLNKRFVADRSTGIFDCGEAFHLANNPAQWAADYSEFIAAQIASLTPRPKNVVLVGVSEGALPAARVAARFPSITHLAIIGSGGYSMRKSLSTLVQRRAISFDVDKGWQEISSEPRSIVRNWYGNSYRWWSDVMDIEPLDDYLQLNIPILVGIGEDDTSVPVESARFLEDRMKATGKSNFVLKVYPGADHRLSSHGVSYRKDFFAELSRILDVAQGSSLNAARP